jgi:hypothetical protein
VLATLITAGSIPALAGIAVLAAILQPVAPWPGAAGLAVG